MKRLYVALTLLLMSFLSALEHLDGLRNMVARVGVYRWVPELLLAAAAVAVFVMATQLHRRLLFPRRGMRILAAGIAVYAVAVAAATGAAATALGVVAIEKGSPWSAVPELLGRFHPQPVFVAALLLLILGAFRALTNLVPPNEFEADF